MLDYEALRFIWWVLLGVLLTGFAILDGFDLGVGMLNPFLSKENLERRVILNTIAPVWEGNQVWLILGAGAVFAAWPAVYAVVFSGLYLPFIAALIGLIIRPVALKFRSKSWPNFWDWMLCVACFLPTFLLGVALANIAQGLPFSFDTELRMTYSGSVFALLNPLGIIGGFLSVSLLLTQGALYLQLKVKDILQEKLHRTIIYLNFITTILLIISGSYALLKLKLYLPLKFSYDGPSNPLFKEITGLGFYNVYMQKPLLWFFPLAMMVVSVSISWLVKLHNKITAFIMHSILIAIVIAAFGVNLFPIIIPSSIDPIYSLMVWDASSSERTLLIMLIAVLLLLPIVLLYTSWMYKVFATAIGPKDIKEDMY